MSIYTPSTDYSALRNAIALQADAKQHAHRATQQRIDTERLGLQDKSLDIQQNSLDFQKGILIANTVLTAAKIGAEIYTDVKTKAIQAELATAKTDALDAAAEFDELIVESILNGKTRAVQNADGLWDIIPDQSLIQWRNDQMEAIASSSDSKEVKQWRMQTLSNTYSAGQSKILSGILNQTQATINDHFNINLSKALETDAQTGSYEMGAAVISSRSDFNDLQKEVAFANYQKSVDKRFQTTEVSRIAFTEGLSAATEYAYGLKGFTPEEIQGFVATAKRTDDQITSAIATKSAELMASGLELGVSPAELYKTVDDYVNDMPENRRQAAKETARAAHTAWATKQGYALANADLESVDVEYLTERKDSITQKDGAIYQSTFYGLDQTATTFGNMYAKRIKELKDLETTTLSNLTKEQIKENKTFMDATVALLKNGDISPAAAMQAIRKYDVSNTDSIEDDFHQLKLLNEMNDNIVPERYKAITTAFLKEMEKLNFGIEFDSKKGMTAEQTMQLADARDFANTAIANIFMNTAANEISPNEVADQLGRIKSTFIGKSVSALESGEVIDRWRLFRDPKAIDDALDKNHQFGGLSTMPITMDRDGNIQWANRDQKATFDAVAGEIASELERLGLQVTSESSPMVMQTGDNIEIKPVPIIQGIGEDGVRRWYTVNQNDVFAKTDTGDWEYQTSISTVKKFKDETELDRYFDQFRDGKPKEKKGILATYVGAIKPAMKILGGVLFGGPKRDNTTR